MPSIWNNQQAGMDTPDMEINTDREFEPVLANPAIPLSDKAGKINMFFRTPMGPQYKSGLRKLLADVGGIALPVSNDDSALINAALRITPQEWFNVFARNRSMEMPQQPQNIPQMAAQPTPPPMGATPPNMPM